VTAKLRPWSAVLLILLFAGCASARDNLAELRSKFARDPDPVHRAKLMRQLGRAEFDAIRKAIDGGQFAEALSILQQYRDESQWCAKALDDKESDPAKHSNGFKQLQISVRESLRRLDGLLVGFTADQQQPFLEIRMDLDELNRHLLRELFPNTPAKDGSSLQTPPERSAYASSLFACNEPGIFNAAGFFSRALRSDTFSAKRLSL
jgi:hypothetical protein